MQVSDAVKALNAAIAQSEECREFARAKEEIAGDGAMMSLLQEYRRMQTALQLCYMSGKQMSNEDDVRFQQLGLLLYADSRTADYLMAEMRLQKLMGEVFESITHASGMDFPLPGC